MDEFVNKGPGCLCVLEPFCYGKYLVSSNYTQVNLPKIR